MNSPSGDDCPDEIWIGPVGPIPIHYDDDPRLVEDRRAWQMAAAAADAMVTPDELLRGIRSDDWHIRVWVVDRLMARTRDDERLVPALLEALRVDAAWQVRDQIAIALGRLVEDDRVSRALSDAQDDECPEVRTSAGISLENGER